MVKTEKVEYSITWLQKARDELIVGWISEYRNQTFFWASFCVPSYSISGLHIHKNVLFNRKKFENFLGGMHLKPFKMVFRLYRMQLIINPCLIVLVTARHWRERELIRQTSTETKQLLP